MKRKITIKIEGRRSMRVGLNGSGPRYVHLMLDGKWYFFFKNDGDRNWKLECVR